jgi:hypothetical protein
MCSDRRSGHAVMEFALISPWLFTLFVGTLNVGLLHHSVTAVQNAARSAALYASSSPWNLADEQGVCRTALRELRSLPNARTSAACDAPPVEVVLTSPEGVAGEQVARVSLTYQSIRLITMPPLPSRVAITRTAEMRVRAE